MPLIVIPCISITARHRAATAAALGRQRIGHIIGVAILFAGRSVLASSVSPNAVKRAGKHCAACAYRYRRDQHDTIQMIGVIDSRELIRQFCRQRTR